MAKDPEDLADENGAAAAVEPEAIDADVGFGALALEEIPQAEAEAFTSELQEAEEQGVDPFSLEVSRVVMSKLLRLW